MTLIADPPVSLPPVKETPMETPVPTQGQILAALIRAGIRRRPSQVFHQAFRGREGSCVVGALYDGLVEREGRRLGFSLLHNFAFVVLFNLGFSVLHSKLGCDFTQPVTHPVSGAREALYNVIIALNDEERWSREEIADWLEQALP